MAQINTAADINAFICAVQDDVQFVLRDSAIMRNLVTFRGDMTGAGTRTAYAYGAGTAKTLAETDDLTGDPYTPTAAQTLTPAEIGEQYFFTDLRLETEPAGQLQNEASTELANAAVDKVETDLMSDLARLTGGTVGAAGSVMSWGYFFAAAAQLRNRVKNRSIPLFAVLHDYQWYPLAKSVSVAGATVVNAPLFQDKVMNAWYVGTVAGVNVFTSSNVPVDASDDAKGGMFIPDAIMYDERRAVRIRPERDESRRGLELNMSAVYAHGVWRPDHGIVIYSDATMPTS